MAHIENEMLLLMRDDIEFMPTTAFIGQGDFDNYHEWFERMVEIAEGIDFSVHATVPTFALAGGVSSNMCRTAMRCRDPGIRRRAVKIIEVANRQEGILKTKWMVRIATRAIELEEDGLSVKTALDIPQERRLQDFRIDWNSGIDTVPSARYYFKDRVVVEPLSDDGNKQNAL